MSEIHVPSHVSAPWGRPARGEAAELQNANAALREKVGLLSRAIALKETERTNSLSNLAQSLGGMRQDGITSMNPLYSSSQYFPLSVDYPLLGYLYQTHGIFQTMIDEPILDAFRSDEGPGFELTSREMGQGSVGKDGIGELEDFAEEIGAWETLKYFLGWGGLYGGSGLVVNAAQDPDKPLDERDVRRGRLDFYDADRWEFSGAYRHAKTFSFYGQTLDASRVITYGGKRAPRLIRNVLGGWGMSEMQRAVEDFNVWLRGRNALYATIDRANIDVYKIKGYGSSLATPDGEQTVRNRILMTNQILNFVKALIIDGDDSYEVVPRQFQGLAEVMREIRIGISCATRMPYQKLWGTSAGSGGLNDSGETDMENYNAMVISRVRTPARPIIRKMLRLMMFAVFGKEYDISFKFKPLRVLSAKDEEEIRKSKQERYVTLYDKKLLTSQEMGDLMHKENLVPIETLAQKGKLPTFSETPTAAEMFKEETDAEPAAGDGKETRGGDAED